MLGGEIVDQRKEHDVDPEHDAAEEHQRQAQLAEAPASAPGQLEAGDVEEQREREQARDLGGAPELDPVRREEDEQAGGNGDPPQWMAGGIEALREEAPPRGPFTGAEAQEGQRGLVEDRGGE